VKTIGVIRSVDALASWKIDRRPLPQVQGISRAISAEVRKIE
jgi:hypothetical protein